MNLNQTHLGIYPVPSVKNGMDVEALCELSLRSVVIVDSWEASANRDWQKVIEELNPITNCTQCLRIARTLSAERPQDCQYIYALISRDSKLGQRLAGREEQSA